MPPKRPNSKVIFGARNLENYFDDFSVVEVLESAKEIIGKNPELTVIKKIHANFGRQTFVITAVATLFMFLSLGKAQKVQMQEKKEA